MDGRSLPESLEILSSACERFGYAFTLVDTFSGYLAEVSDGRRRFLAGAGRVSCYPLNAATPLLVARDKAHTYDLLARNGFPIPRTGAFFVSTRYLAHRPPGRELGDAVAFAEGLGYPVFVKPNTGSFARGAAAVFDRNDLLYALEGIAATDYLAIVQEYLALPELRLFVLDGRVEFAYRKQRPSIAGDGTSTVGALLAAAAPADGAGDGAGDELARRLAAGFLRRELETRGLTEESVLPAGDRLTVSPIGNVSAGGVIERFHAEVPAAVHDWAAALAAVVDLRVFGVDVLTDAGIERPETFRVLDVNATPVLGSIVRAGYEEHAMAVWKRIFEAYFDRDLGG